jgi:thiol-disulfide isomerase/thioredoxin
MRKVTFLTRRGCTLCDEAWPHVAEWADRLQVGVEVVDVDAEGLAERYGDRVPVVLGPEGDELLAGRFGRLRVLRAMLRARYG